jgi:hypothetical protein
VPARPCRADLLGLPFDPNGPSVLATNGSLSYTAATGEFSSTAVPLAYSSPTLPGGGFVRFSGGAETIDLFVDPDGTFRGDGSGMQLKGTLSIGGTSISGTLLSGDITAFGADSAGPPTWASNELFTVTGGLLTAPILLNNGEILPSQFTVGSLVGAIEFAENVKSGTLGDFTHDFRSGNVKDTDGLVMVPEPGTAWPFLLGMVAVIGFVVITKRTA